MSKAQTGSAARVSFVVLSYTLFAALWILLSDRAMGVLFRDPELLVLASMAKGWFFVVVTSLLLYGLVRRHTLALVGAHQRELALERERKVPPPMLVAIAEASGDAIFAKDEEGRYLFVNNAAARFVGRHTGETLGRDARALFPPDQAEQVFAADRAVLAGGQPETREETLHTPDGERVFLVTRGPCAAPTARCSAPTASRATSPTASARRKRCAAWPTT